MPEISQRQDPDKNLELSDNRVTHLTKFKILFVNAPLASLVDSSSMSSLSSPKGGGSPGCSSSAGAS